MTGFVSIVGAGPGDPELLTRKAVDRLQRADLVLYDALVSRECLDFAGDARRVFAGKRSGETLARQRQIEQLMISAAREGKRVVRLKGGDPFVLGRGGEEALALVEAGIPFEVIPGVSSALAAPARAGIPVTHRGIASGFLVVSGHAKQVYGPILEGIIPNSITLVVLMGLASRREISRFLLDHGWRVETPAAIIWAASCPEEEAWVGTLSELGDTAEARGRPGTMVVGDVVPVGTSVRSFLVAGGGASVGAP